MGFHLMGTFNIKKSFFIFFLCLFLFMGFNTPDADTPLNIVVLTGDEMTSTRRSFSGARIIIQQEHPEAVFHQFLIGQDLAQISSLVDTIRFINPKLIFTIGSSATEFAKDNFSDVPVVFSSVKYPVLSGFVNSTSKPGGNITGASIDIPFDIQFTKFREIIPTLKKIGVMYTQNTASLIPQAKLVAKELGFELIAIEVKSDRDLPHALDSLTSTVQGIWSVADINLFKPKATRYILINTLKKRVPFMGFSKYVVESGALFALDFDYKAVGIQAGNIVNKVLDGTSPAEISVTTADLIWFHYNKNTSERINIAIPEELAAVAKEVYR